MMKLKKILKFGIVIFALAGLATASLAFTTELISRISIGSNFSTIGSYYLRGFSLVNGSFTSNMPPDLSPYPWTTLTPSTVYYIKVPTPSDITCDNLGLALYYQSGYRSFNTMGTSVTGVATGGDCEFTYIVKNGLINYNLMFLTFYDYSGSSTDFTMVGDDDPAVGTFDYFSGSFIQHGTPAFTLSSRDTCYDGIQNQDETGVDDGGVCTLPAARDILLDTMTGNSFFQLVSPHYGFTPTASGTLDNIDLAFTTRDVSVDFVATLEDSFFVPIDCVSDTISGLSGNDLNTHSIITHITGFRGEDCALSAGQNYIINFGALNAFGGIWGDAGGSVGGGYGIYYGKFETPTCTTDCFSNVLFLPGIKGSVLKKSADTLWPPTVFSFNDIEQLTLTDEGESEYNIYTDGILNKFHTTSIYQPFTDFMDNLVSQGLISEWLPLAYDWRFSPEKILQDGIKTQSEVLNVIDEIETLATNSKSGKVTIVAHSMGGFFGKAIIKELESRGESDLIDSFIMIGTPQLGTPQAIAAMLHGDDEGIAAGLIVDASEMRAIAQNIPGAYNLLPSSRYFDKVSDPVIKFDPTKPFTEAWRNLWGETISVYNNYFSFLIGADGRNRPAENMLQIPEVLRGDLMLSAKNFHDEYDEYSLPADIRVVQVAGWGLPTTKAVNYTTKHTLQNFGYETIPTREGDGTVVYPSAISSVADETYFFNVFEFNKQLNSSAQHRDLLNTNALQDLVKSAIKNEDISNTNFIFSTKPQVTDLADQLMVRTNSPVVLGVYDQSRNFTGVDPNQDLSADVWVVKENIPGSTFSYTSESQSIFLPKEGIYDFIYKGTGTGPTTVEIGNFTTDTVLPLVSYTDIPTTPDTIASFTVESDVPENTAIELDADGDGATDETINPDNYEPSLNELLVLIKERISALNIKDNLKKNLLKKIAGLEKKIENKKQKNLKTLSGLEKKISNQEIKGKINSLDASEIISFLNTLEAQAEDVALDPTVITDLKNKIQTLDIADGLRNNLLKQVEKLEKKEVLIKALSNLSKNIIKKAEKGKVADADAQILIDLLNQIEGVI